MGKNGKETKHEQDPNEIFYGLLKKGDIDSLRESFQQPKVISFCYWLEEQLRMKFSLKFNCKKFIDDINSDEITFKKYSVTIIKSYQQKKLFSELVQFLEDEQEKCFLPLIDFLYCREVLLFYRKVTAILSPIVDLDIISISKVPNKEMMSDELVQKLEILVRMEFSYWAEKFVTSWYENISHDDLFVSGVPIGPIAEYDLMQEVVSLTPDEIYWNYGAKNEL